MPTSDDEATLPRDLDALNAAWKDVSEAQERSDEALREEVEAFNATWNEMLVAVEASRRRRADR